MRKHKCFHGGELIGSGQFGNVYDEVSDICIDCKPQILCYDGEQGCTDQDINGKCVFKLFEENKEKEIEKANNQLIHRFISMSDPLQVVRLTSLQPSIKSVKYNSDEFLVYRKMDTNLLKYLFEYDEDAYLKEWKYSKAVVDHEFINNVMTQALSLCSILHEKGYIHRDIKLDNFLISNSEKRIVLADYGMLCKVTDDKTASNVEFEGMTDFMPPFCHYNGNNQTSEANYAKSVAFLFFGDDDRSKHPYAMLADRDNKAVFLNEVVKSYTESSDKDNNVKYKLDLHPLGIVLLQLLKRAHITDNDSYYMFARKLMMHESVGGYRNAITALEAWQKDIKRGGSRTIHVLGRSRKIHVIKGKEYVTNKGKLITIKQAQKLAKGDIKKDVKVR